MNRALDKRARRCSVALAALALGMTPGAAAAHDGYLRSLPPDPVAPLETVDALAVDPADSTLLVLGGRDGRAVLRRVAPDGTRIGQDTVLQETLPFGATLTIDAEPLRPDSRIYVSGLRAGGAGRASLIELDGNLKELPGVEQRAPFAGLTGPFEVHVDEGVLADPADDAFYVIEGEFGPPPRTTARRIRRVVRESGAVTWQRSELNGDYVDRYSVSVAYAVSAPSGALVQYAGSVMQHSRDGSALLSTGILDLAADTMIFSSSLAAAPDRAAVTPHRLDDPNLGAFGNGAGVARWNRTSSGLGLLNSMILARRMYGWRVGEADVPAPPAGAAPGACRYTRDERLTREDYFGRVHAAGPVIALAPDETLYVGDRPNGRIDVFGEGGERPGCGRGTVPIARAIVTPTIVASGGLLRADPVATSPSLAMPDPRNPPNWWVTDADSIVKWEWDGDGDGVYEVVRNDATPFEVRAGAPGTQIIGLRVTDTFGLTDTVSIGVPVVGEPPVAALSARPAAISAGESVLLDASGSRGDVVRFEWDLDGDGVFERDTARGATVSERFATPGTRVLAVRVTSDEGVRDTTTLTLPVGPAAVPPPPAPSALMELPPAFGGAAAVPPAGGDRTAPRLRLPSRVRARGGRVSFALGCPASERTCLVTVRLGSAEDAFTLAGGRERTVRLPLARSTARRVRAGASARLSLRVRVQDAAGNVRSLSRRVTVSAAGGAKRAASSGAAAEAGS